MKKTRKEVQNSGNTKFSQWEKWIKFSSFQESSFRLISEHCWMEFVDHLSLLSSHEKSSHGITRELFTRILRTSRSIFFTPLHFRLLLSHVTTTPGFISLFWGFWGYTLDYWTLNMLVISIAEVPIERLSNTVGEFSKTQWKLCVFDWKSFEETPPDKQLAKQRTRTI